MLLLILRYLTINNQQKEYKELFDDVIFIFKKIKLAKEYHLFLRTILQIVFIKYI